MIFLEQQLVLCHKNVIIMKKKLRNLRKRKENKKEKILIKWKYVKMMILVQMVNNKILLKKMKVIGKGELLLNKQQFQSYLKRLKINKGLMSAKKVKVNCKLLKIKIQRILKDNVLVFQIYQKQINMLFQKIFLVSVHSK